MVCSKTADKDSMTMWSWSNLQSNRLSDIPVTRNDLNLSLNAESELVKFCSRKKLLMKDLLIVAQSYI